MDSKNSSENDPKETDNYQRLSYLLALRQWNISYPISVGLMMFGALAAAGVVLQSIYVSRALTESQTEFRAAQRARIVLGNEQGVPVEIKDFGNTSKIVIYMRNDGRITANNVVMKIAVLFAPPNSSAQYISLNPAPGVFETGVTIGQGEPYTFYQTINRDDANAVRNGTKALRIVGRVIYWDSFGDYCEPLGYGYFNDPVRFEPNVIPPRESVCDPQSGEGEVLFINPQGGATTALGVREGSTFAHEHHAHESTQE